MIKKTLAWALSVVMLIGMMSGIALVTSATEVTDPTTLVGAETLTFSGLVSGNDVLYSNAGFTTVSSEDELFTVKDISETTFFHGNYMGGCMKPYNNDYNVNFFKLDLTEFVAANGAAVDVYLRAKKNGTWNGNMLAVGIGNGANGGGNNQYYYGAGSTEVGNGYLSQEWQWCRFSFADVTASYNNVLVVSGTSLNHEPIFISDVVVTVKDAPSESELFGPQLEALLATLPDDIQGVEALMEEFNVTAYNDAVAAAQAALDSGEGIAEALEGLKAAVALIRAGAYDSVSFIGLVDGNDKVNGIDVDLGTINGENNLFNVNNFLTGNDYGAGITFVHGNYMGGCLKPACSNYNVNFFKLDLTKFVEAHGSAVDVYIRAKQNSTWYGDMLAVGIGNGANGGGNNQYYYGADSTNEGNGYLSQEWQWCRFSFADVTASYNNVLVVSGVSLNHEPIFISDIIIAEQGTTAEDVQVRGELDAAVEAATGISADDALTAALNAAQAVQAIAPGNTATPLAAPATQNLFEALAARINDIKLVLADKAFAPLNTSACTDAEAVARYDAAIVAARGALNSSNQEISDAYVELMAAEAPILRAIACADLAAAIEKAEAIVELEFTADDDVSAAYAAAIEAAKAAYADETLTWQEIEAATAAMTEATATYTVAVVDMLNPAWEEAKAELAEIDYSIFTEQSVAALNAAIDGVDTALAADPADLIDISEKLEAFVDAALGLEVAYTLGDVDDDGDIDSTDARLALQLYVGMEVDINLMAADVDGDGDVDSTDARLILQYYVEVIDEFPAETMTIE